MRISDFSADQLGVIRLVAGLRGGEPAKRSVTWRSLVRRGVLVLGHAPNGARIHVFTKAGLELVRDLQGRDSGR